MPLTVAPDLQAIVDRIAGEMQDQTDRGKVERRAPALAIGVHVFAGQMMERGGVERPVGARSGAIERAGRKAHEVFAIGRNFAGQRAALHVAATWHGASAHVPH